MSDDRRAATRKDAFRIGSLTGEGVAEACECLVWDLSDAGAQVEVTDAEAVPDAFTLLVTAYDVPRSCTVIRRDGRRLGVRFGA